MSEEGTLTCPEEHTLHQDPDYEGARVWVTCGDHTIAERIWAPTQRDLSAEIRHFTTRTMDRHAIEWLRAEVLRLRAALRVALEAT